MLKALIFLGDSTIEWSAILQNRGIDEMKWTRIKIENHFINLWQFRNSVPEHGFFVKKEDTSVWPCFAMIAQAHREEWMLVGSPKADCYLEREVTFYQDTAENVGNFRISISVINKRKYYFSILRRNKNYSMDLCLLTFKDDIFSKIWHVNYSQISQSSRRLGALQPSELRR